MSKNQIRSIKGTQDILPKESLRWRVLEKKIHDTMELFNYGEIRTPAFEKTELFDRGVGLQTDIVTKEMYSWIDQGGESLHSSDRSPSRSRGLSKSRSRPRQY